MRVQKNDSGKIISMILDEYGQKFDRCFAQTKSSLEFKELANEFGKEFILPRYDGVLIFSERERRLKLSVFRHCVAVDWRKSRAGCMPFAQLYQPEDRIEYDQDYKSFSRQWQRQPAIIAHMEKGTSYKDYNT